MHGMNSIVCSHGSLYFIYQSTSSTHNIRVLSRQTLLKGYYFLFLQKKPVIIVAFPCWPFHKAVLIRGGEGGEPVVAPSPRLACFTTFCSRLHWPPFPKSPLPLVWSRPDPEYLMRGALLLLLYLLQRARRTQASASCRRLYAIDRARPGQASHGRLACGRRARRCRRPAWRGGRVSARGSSVEYCDTRN